MSFLRTSLVVSLLVVLSTYSVATDTYRYRVDSNGSSYNVTIYDYTPKPIPLPEWLAKPRPRIGIEETERAAWLRYTTRGQVAQDTIREMPYRELAEAKRRLLDAQTALLRQQLYQQKWGEHDATWQRRQRLLAQYERNLATKPTPQRKPYAYPVATNQESSDVKCSEHTYECTAKILCDSLVNKVLSGKRPEHVAINTYVKAGGREHEIRVALRRAKSEARKKPLHIPTVKATEHHRKIANDVTFEGHGKFLNSIMAALKLPYKEGVKAYERIKAYNQTLPLRIAIHRTMNDYGIDSETATAKIDRLVKIHNFVALNDNL